MLMPKRTKYRRPHKVSYEGHVKGANKIDFGIISMRPTAAELKKIETIIQILAELNQGNSEEENNNKEKDNFNNFQ